MKVRTVRAGKVDTKAAIQLRPRLPNHVVRLTTAPPIRKYSRYLISPATSPTLPRPAKTGRFSPGLAPPRRRLYPWHPPAPCTHLMGTRPGRVLFPVHEYY